MIKGCPVDLVCWVLALPVVFSAGMAISWALERLVFWW